MRGQQLINFQLADLFDHLLSCQLGFPQRLHEDLIGVLVGEQLAALPDEGRVEEVDEALKVILGLLNLEQYFDKLDVQAACRSACSPFAPSAG